MRHSIVRDGIVAGVLGATAVAVWFLGVDILYSHPLATPAALGTRCAAAVRAAGHVKVRWCSSWPYTIFHYAAFIAAGLLVSVIVHWAQSQPIGPRWRDDPVRGVRDRVLRTGARRFEESPFLGALGWAQVAIGNLIAAAVDGDVYVENPSGVETAS